jgi:hypothetical protein
MTMNKILLFMATVLFLLFGYAVSSFAQNNYPLQECTVFNLTLTDAGTEYSHEILPQSKLWSVKARTANAFKYSWTSGTSGTVYRTVPASSEHYLMNAWFMTKRTIYFQSSTAALILEIETCR